MPFSRRLEKYVDFDEMQELLTYARKYCAIRFCSPEIPLGMYAYVEDSMSYVKLTMKKDLKACTYIFRKDLQRMPQRISGMDAYIELSKAWRRATGYRIPEIYDDYGSATAFLAYRKDYDRKRVKAIAYDQNSSYAWAMKQPMPDTREIVGFNRKPNRGEVGFTCIETQKIDGWEIPDESHLQMNTFEDGYTCDYIFKTMHSPFTNFAELWYNRKVNATTAEEKDKAKQMLVYSVGYLQKKNPLLRSAIISYANSYIRSLIDENTIYCNTDSIVSLKPREDLPLGNGIGQFKIEHEGMFAHDGFNYQWDLNVPSYRHIPKSWFPEGWDILNDRLPDNGNVYELNRITLRLEDYNGKQNSNQWYTGSVDEKCRELFGYDSEYLVR